VILKDLGEELFMAAAGNTLFHLQYLADHKKVGKLIEEFKIK
jgi:hypothetical protein